MAIIELIENPQITLLNVEYKAVRCPDDFFDGNSNFSVDVKDHFECKYVTESNKLAALFHRSVSLNPPQLFAIDVYYQINWDVNKDGIEALRNGINELDLSEKNYICYSAKIEAAMLIAQMTKSNTMFPPLWTPNTIIEEKEDR